MAERWRFERHAVTGTVGLANPDRNPSAYTLHLAEGGWYRSANLSVSLVFETRPETFLGHLPSGGERVRTMPMPCGTIGFQNRAGNPPDSLSRLADDKRVELSTFRSHRISNARPEPSGDIVHSGAPGGIRTRHCLVPKTSASYRWATGANWCGISDSNGY